MEPTRRTVLAGIGATLAIGGGATQVFGQQGDSPTFTVLDVSATEDTVSFYNASNGAVDLSGWTVDFQYGDNSKDETGEIPGGTTVQANDSVVIASGAVDVSDADAVVQPPFDHRVIERSRSDVIALLDADGNEVANSEDDTVGGGSGGGGDISTTEEETTSTEESTTTTEDTTTTDEGTTTTEDESTTTKETTTTSDNDGTTTTDGGNETTTTTTSGNDSTDNGSDGTSGNEDSSGSGNADNGGNSGSDTSSDAFGSNSTSDTDDC